MKIACLFCLALAAVCSGYAQDSVTGTTLQERCRTINQDHESLTQRQQNDLISCLGYIRGTLDTIETWRNIEPRTADVMVRNTCVPNEVSAGQAAKIIIKYLDAHPENLHFDGPVIITLIMRETYPCK